MGELPLTDIAELLLAESRRAGASAADVVVAEADSLSVGVRLGNIEKLKQARQKHLGLRVFVGERSAVTSSADFSRDSLLRLAAETVELAKVIAADPCAGLPDPADLATTFPDLDLYDPAVAQVTPEQGMAMAMEAERAAMAADARITNSEGAEFGASTSRVLYGSTGGFRGEYRDSGVSLSVVPVATDNGSMQRDYWYSSQRRVDRLEPPEHVGRTAAARALRRLNARKVATREVPVIFDPEMAGGLLRQLAAAVSGYALYKGTSFLIGKLGARIAPEHVTVIDDGTIAGGLGSKPFDGEGLPTRRTVVVDRGVLTSYLFDTYSARRLEMRSTGNAARSVGDAPRVAPTNLYLVAGMQTPEAIVASVDRGLYVTELIGFGVNPVTGDYSRGAVGLWIEDGAFSHPVEEVTIAGNLLDMFAGIEAVGSDLAMRHSVSAPTLKIARMTVAGG